MESRAPNNIFPVNYRPLSSKGFVYDYLEAKLREERPGQQLEIESRLGAFVPAPLAQTLEASLQAPIIFGGRAASPALRQLLRSPQQPRFEPSLVPARFYAIAEACARHQPQTTAQASIDFVLRDGHNTRLSWELSAGAVSETTKSDKESIDLAHQGRAYRLSTAFETLKPVPAALFEAQIAQHGCSSIRLKLRRVTPFQFMHVCCTHCLGLRRDAVKHKLLELFRQAPAGAETVEAVRRLLAANGAEESFEIENEIADANFLRETLRAPETRAHFPAFVDRFLRNTELLDSDLRRWSEESLAALLGAAPVVGSYLADVLAEPNTPNRP